MAIVRIGVSNSPQKHHPLFLAKPPPPPPLNLQTAQAPLFRQFPPLYWSYVNPLIKSDFSVNPQDIKVFNP